ncbi:MAG: PAS domain S-box protein [Actinomycetota bacterium]
MDWEAGHGPFRSMVDGLPVVTYVEEVAPDPAWPPRVVYVNSYARSLLGFRPEEWLAGSGFRWGHTAPTDRERVARLYDATVKTGLPFRAEYRMTASGGREVWVLDRAAPAVNDGGPLLVYGVLLDVTEGRRAEDERRERQDRLLHERERQFQHLFQASPDAVLLIDPDDPSVSWPIVDCNEAACRMNGYTREELVGRSVDMLNVSPGSPEERARYLERLRRDRVISVEAEHRYKGGRIFPVEVSTSLITFEGRELVLGIDRDITERKRTEHVLRRALESERETGARLRDLDLMKNAFVSAVSHDLRTPLTTVLGSALTLERLRPTLSVDDQDHLIRAISSNAQRLQRMLTDLLDLDRLTRGALEPVRSPTDLPALVRRVVEDSGILEDHVVHLDVDPMVLQLDSPKVERIVDNLLMNARRHTLPGTDVWVAAHPVEEGVLLLVEDAGPGVPAESRGVIFEPFHQVGQPDPNSSGVGIGLSLVTKFAELHGGRAWVEHRQGGGASFRVFLPTADRSEAPAQPGEPARA